MPQYLVAECLLQPSAGRFEALELAGGEAVEVVAVRAHEMREHRARYDGLLMAEPADQLVDVILGVESQPVHAGVELDMHWPSCDALLACRPYECVHQSEGVDLRLQVVVEHGLEGRHLGVHHHDVGGDAGLAEGDALVGHRHGEIVHALILQRLGHLHGPRSVGIGLDHAHHLRVGLQE